MKIISYDRIRFMMQWCPKFVLTNRKGRSLISSAN